MSLTMHIFKKDLRRLRVFLCFWLPMALIAGIASSIRAPADDFAIQTTLKVVTALATGCQFLMVALIVPFLMHSEPLTGTTAFWFTRPIRKIDIVKSKLLFSGLFFIIVPVLIKTVLLIANQVPLQYVLAAAFENLIHYTCTLLLLLAIASLTRNFGLFALTGAIYLTVAIIFGVAITITDQFQLLENIQPGLEVTDSRNLLSSIVAIIMLSGLLFIQYRYRKTRWSYGLLALEFLATLWIGSFSSIPLFKKAGGSLSAKEAACIEVSVIKKNTHVSDSFSMRRQKIKSKEVSGDFLAENLPEHAFAKASRIKASFEADGLKAGEPYRGSTSHSSQWDRNALESLIEPGELIHKRSGMFYTEKLLKLQEPDYLALKGKTGTYRADVTFDVFRYKKAATLQLSKGQHYKNGPTRITVASVLNETEGCSVIVHEQHIDPLFKRDRKPHAGNRLIYLLSNPATGETHLPEDDNHSVITLGKTTDLISRNKILRFSSIDKPTNIDETWLKNAELLIIETEWLGDVEKQITDPSFTLGSSSSYSSTIPHTGASDNAEKLANIQLPTTPTREELNSYIKKIHTISATQSKFSTSDPQKTMLMAVGPDHLDLLLESAINGTEHYEIYAIKELAKQEHKELILSKLEQLPALAEVVVKLQWENDARDILLKGLKQNDYLPNDWVKAVAGFNDPETYSQLIYFFINGNNRDSTYKAIKNLPGIDLENAVSKAWKKTKYEDEWVRRDMMTIAMEYGHIDALKQAVLELGNSSCPEYTRRKLRNSFTKHTGIEGPDDRLQEWYRRNKGTIHFDPETRMYIAEDSEIQPHSPDILNEELEEELNSWTKQLSVEMEISELTRSDKGDIHLKVKENKHFIENASILIPESQDLKETILQIRTVISINETKPEYKRIKSLTPHGSKIAVSYE